MKNNRHQLLRVLESQKTNLFFSGFFVEILFLHRVCLSIQVYMIPYTQKMYVVPSKTGQLCRYNHDMLLHGVFGHITFKISSKNTQHCPAPRYNCSVGEKNTNRTLPRTNIAPANMVSQKEIHLPTIHFQVLC